MTNLVFTVTVQAQVTTCNLVNKANLVHNFYQRVYLFFINVSGYYVPIIRRNNCIYATFGICHSVWMIVWYALWNIQPAYHTVTHTERQITIVPQIQLFLLMMGTYVVARNLQRKETNILREIVHDVGFIYKIIQGCTVDKTLKKTYKPSNTFQEIITIIIIYYYYYLKFIFAISNINIRFYQD